MPDTSGKKNRDSKKAKKKEAIRQLMKYLPELAASPSEDEQGKGGSNRPIDAQKGKASKKGTNNFLKGVAQSPSGNTSRMGVLLGQAATDPVRIPDFERPEDLSFEEWKKNNPCLLDMHVEGA